MIDIGHKTLMGTAPGQSTHLFNNAAAIPIKTSRTKQNKQ